MSSIRQLTGLFILFLIFTLPNVASQGRQSKSSPKKRLDKKHRMVRDKDMSMKRMTMQKHMEEMDMMMNKMNKEKNLEERNRQWNELMKRMREQMALMRGRMEEMAPKKDTPQKESPL